MSLFSKLAQKAREENEQDYQYMKKEEERQKMKVEKTRAIQDSLPVCANCCYLYYSASYGYCCAKECVTNVSFTVDEVEKEGEHWVTSCLHFRKKD